jgi:hypothetical protein
VEDEAEVLPRFKQYYETHGFTRLQYKVLWYDNSPVDTPFEAGWQHL